MSVSYFFILGYLFCILVVCVCISINAYKNKDMDFDHLIENVTSLEFTNEWVQRVCRFLFSVFWIFLVGAVGIIAWDDYWEGKLIILPFVFGVVAFIILAMVLAMIIFSISKLLYWIWIKE